MGVLLWIIVIGFVAGIIARLIMPGPNTPKGFVLTTILGIAGALLATFVGEAIGLYRPGQGAGFIGATVGALDYIVGLARLVAAGDPSQTTAFEICQFADSIQRRNRPPAMPRVSARLYSRKTFGCVPATSWPILDCIFRGAPDR